MSFALDPRLEADTAFVGDFPLCRVLLMNDARFPWLILTPRRAGLVEILDLSAEERARLTEEAAVVAAAMRRRPEVEKINLGALGNIVRQLHLHVVGRRAGDAAWPGPVWGSGLATAYAADELPARVAQWRRDLKLA